jgi:hypothetical protein
VAKMLLEIALASSFDGLSDLKTWRRKGILDDCVWQVISKKLQLDEAIDRSLHEIKNTIKKPYVD